MNNQKGFALVTVLLLTVMVIIAATLALNTVNHDMKIASMDRNLKQSFITAESGVEEARGRLNYSVSTAIIPDNTPSNPNWKAFIGTLTNCQALGFDSSNSNHFRYDSVVGTNYTVVITHKVNGSNQVLLWADANLDGKPEENLTTGEPIYIVTSTGTNNGATKVVRTEITRVPAIQFPAAFYSKELVKVQGSSTIIKGDTLPGILSMVGVNTAGSPSISGTPAIVTGSPININVNSMVDTLKGSATSSYTPATLPTNQNWGTPIEGALDTPLSCNTSQTIYIEGNVTLNNASGCGTLLVKGDLSLHGGFKWFGPIVATGDVTYTGGGQKNITGGIMSGGVGDVNDIGGNAVILYSPLAIYFQTSHSPLLTLKWEEVFTQ